MVAFNYIREFNFILQEQYILYKGLKRAFEKSIDPKAQYGLYVACF